MKFIFDFGPVVQEILFKDISYLELWQPFCLAEQNNLCNYARGHYEKHFCEIILNLDQWLKRKLFKIFLIYSSGSPLVQLSRTICAILVEVIMRNICEIILNLDQWFRRISGLKILSRALATLYWANLVEGIMRNIYVKLL